MQIYNKSECNNLNTRFTQYENAGEMYQEMLELTKSGGDYTVRNYVGVITDMSLGASMVETELFPKGALEYYAKKNMGLPYSAHEASEFQMEKRGGEQGDYSFGATEKILNIVNCLKEHPYSKRAIFPIPFANEPSIKVNFADKGQTKCVRELHFYLDGNKLGCTGFLRMQNAVIFPKNIYFIASLMQHIAEQLPGVVVGCYTHFVTSLCLDREAKHC